MTQALTVLRPRCWPIAEIAQLMQCMCFCVPFFCEHAGAGLLRAALLGRSSASMGETPRNRVDCWVTMIRPRAARTELHRGPEQPPGNGRSMCPVHGERADMSSIRWSSRPSERGAFEFGSAIPQTSWATAIGDPSDAPAAIRFLPADLASNSASSASSTTCWASNPDSGVQHATPPLSVTNGGSDGRARVAERHRRRPANPLGRDEDGLERPAVGHEEEELLAAVAVGSLPGPRALVMDSATRRRVSSPPMWP